MTRRKLVKIIVSVLIAALTALAGFLTTACNVTRTVTTESRYWQRGDTTCTIVTKTTEAYDASKK